MLFPRVLFVFQNFLCYFFHSFRAVKMNLKSWEVTNFIVANGCNPQEETSTYLERAPQTRSYPMRRFAVPFVALLFTAATTTLLADPIPYPNVGTIAPQNAIMATATGDVTGYFVQGGAASGGGAADLDFVRLFDVTTGTTSGFMFNNQTSTPGLTANFGHVNMGDKLVFELENVSLGSIILASDSTISSDGVNHAYTTAFAGGVLNGASIPAGTYVGMEDLPSSGSDFNYNDDSFVFTDVSTSSPVPEPGSILLFGSGILAAAGLIRRRLLT
jgi:PEP-CTERM motif